MKATMTRTLLAAAAAAGFLAPAAAASDVPQDAIQRIERALPKEASAKPKASRKLLVCTLAKGFKHGSIPYCAETIVRMGKATGAFEAEVSDDVSMFERENLDRFDAIVFDNSTGTLFENAELRKGFMEWVKSGKGVVGIHAATDCFYDWPEFGEMMGGWFHGHPWNEQVTIRVEDPDHPVNSAFVGRAFAVADEIYQFKDPYSRENLRVLLSLDVNRTNMEKGGIRRDDRDFAVSWVRSWGEGRVFYCSLGHRNDIFWNPTVLRHYLDGIQFALGDLEADTTPSGALASAVVADAEPGGIWEAAASFEQGASREPLSEIQERVRKVLAGEIERAPLVGRLLALAGDEGATFAGRAFACRQLARIGDDGSVPVLETLLRDEALSHMARYALQRVSGDAAGKALRGALHDLEGEQLVGVINSLGERRDAAAAAILGTMLSELKGDAWAATIEMLGKVGNEQAADVLVDAMAGAIAEDATFPDLGPLPDAVLRCADQLAADVNPGLAASLYSTIYHRPDHPRHVQIAGLLGLVHLQPVETAGEVVGLLGSEDPVWRGTAARLIAEVPGEEVTLAYAEHVYSPPDDVRMQLILALAERGDPRAADAIAEQVVSALPAVQAAAVAALGEVGNESHVPMIAQLAATGSGAARISLAAMKADRVNEAIAGLLLTADTPVRIELARALGARQAYEQAPTLLALMARAEDPALRTAAFESAGIVAGREHIYVMAQLLAQATDDAEKTAGIDCIVTTCRRTVGNAEERAKPVVSALAFAEGAGKASLLRVLGRLGGESALGAVRDGLAEGGEVAAAASIALEKWTDATAAEELLEIAKSTDDPTFRSAAFYGFLRTAAMPGERSPEARVALYRRAFEIAENDKMRRDTLHGVAKVAHPDALELARAHLENEKVRQNAALAMIAIAKATGDGNYDASLAAVKSAVEACPEDGAVRKEAGAALDHLERNVDYVTAWRFAGPFKKDEVGGGALFDVAFPPEPGGPEGEIEWKEIPASALVAPGYVDFMKFAGASECCCYLETVLTSGKAQKVRLELGSDDGIKVWLNGEVVHANNAMRGLSLGSDVVTVDLKEGENTLLLKITQGGGDWRASCRIRSADGHHLSDVRASVPK